jgi:hypothetical protein
MATEQVKRIRPEGSITRNEFEIVKWRDLTAKEQTALAADQRLDYWLKVDKRFVRVGKLISSYDPLLEGRGLWQDFAYSDFSKPSRIKKFYAKYGPMDNFWGKANDPKATRLEPLGRFLSLHSEFLQIVKLYYARKSPARLRGLIPTADGDISQLACENIAATVDGHLSQVLYMLGTANQSFFLSINYRSLIEAVYIQFRAVLLDGAELAPCKNHAVCGFMFIPEHGNQQFHSKACKQAYYDKRREGKQHGDRKCSQAEV